MSQNESGWSVVVGEKPEADSRDEVRHTEKNGQLVVTSQLQIERRTGKVRRPETDVPTTEPRP